MLRSAAAIVVLAMAIGTFITVAFGGGDGDADGPTVVRVNPTSTPSPVPTRAPSATLAVTEGAPAPSPTPFVFETPPPELEGFAYPIDGACLPSSPDLMPGAPRPYRDGTHEGMDFYESDNCVPMPLDTEILAAKAGLVVRADWGYQDLTSEELAALDARVANGEGDDPEVEDIFRGRQVWIDHGNGVLTRYAHLNGIAAGIEVGQTVEQGQAIGYMGESGSPESITAPGTQVHLHFELRVGDAFLGLGLSTDEVRDLYQQVFGP
jgi:murein DD-endopeptidase MepM/ murein hydrolase activator NlpD